MRAQIPILPVGRLNSNLDEIYNIYKIRMELDLDLGTIKTYYEHVYSRAAIIKLVRSSIINPNCSTDETLEGIIESVIR